MSLIQINQVQPWRYDIHSLKNGDVEQIFIGSFEESQDGLFYYYFPNILRPGHLSVRILRELADKLEELNEPLIMLIKQREKEA